MTPISSIPLARPDLTAFPVPEMPQAAGKIGAGEAGQAIGPGPALKAPDGGSFTNLLGQFIEEVDARQKLAGDKVKGVISGQNVPLHDAVIAMEEAGISFQLMVEVRNKLLESYQELMRMQV